jgi:hypothetical protein
MYHPTHSKMELNGDWDAVRLPNLSLPATELSAKYDSLFKTIISAGWAIASDGNVEAPCGYFAKVEIPEHDGERNEIREAVTHSDPDLGKLFDELEPGMYLTQENEAGLIWVYFASDVAIHDCYVQLEGEYTEWSGDWADGFDPQVHG